MVVFVPSWTERVVDGVSCPELNDGEGGKLEFLRLPGGTLRRNFRNNGRGGVFTQTEADSGLVVVWGGQRVVRRVDILDMVCSIPSLLFGAGRT